MENSTTLRIRKMGPARRSFRGVANPDYDPKYDYLYADKDSQTPIRFVARGVDGKLSSHSVADDTPKHLQITLEEEAQAFNLLRFESGDVAVAYLGNDDRLLKTISDADEVVYFHQRYGRLAEQIALDKPEWHTVFVGDHCSPQEAVDRGEKRLGKDGIVTVIIEQP